MFRFTIRDVLWLTVGSLFVAASSVGAEVRDWQFRDMRSKVQAEFVELLEPNYRDTKQRGRPKRTAIPPQVTLKILNGNTITVWLRDLSDEDQAYVRDEIATRLTAERKRNEPFARAIVGRWIESDSKPGSPHMLIIKQSRSVPDQYLVQYIKLQSLAGKELEILWSAFGQADGGSLRVKHAATLPPHTEFQKTLWRKAGFGTPPSGHQAARYEHELIPKLNADGIATELVKATTQILAENRGPVVSRFVRETDKAD